MNSIKVTQDDVQNDYPELYDDFISDLRDSKSISRNRDEEKINWFYSWGNFVKKTNGHDEQVLRELKNQESLEMGFSDRLDFELSKTRVNVTMRANNYTRGDRAKKRLNLPQRIIQIVGEEVKVKMLVEQHQLENQEVIDTIPPINTDIISLKYLKMVLGEDHPHAQEENSEGIGEIDYDTEEEEILDVDIILEKITSEGMEALSDKELKFLESQ